MAPPAGKGPRQLAEGALLQCCEAASLGMPFEVWKTRMGRFRNETTLVAFKNVYNDGGGGFKGVQAFWRGTSAKMVESASKGAVLLYSKEMILASLLAADINPMLAGALAGAAGGVCQVSVMGPCTFLVTAVVTDKGAKLGQTISHTMKTKGVKGFYPGGSAIAMRQATNWASRQAFTEFARKKAKEHRGGGALTIADEMRCGIFGGLMACWNHPFEVARIEMQARSLAGQTKLNMLGVFTQVFKETGLPGLFNGVIPRMGLGVWQTLFMVTAPKIINSYRQ
eukprot:NODE_3302_length_992_cov_27.517919_g3156_i0.p1 GENE.NODE_3302_length_992_cov_27.517919_g3156_i0~~NODE_3302_length_992_cov_27.517919_g3156_i0.p1  ORF type:complete len:282 (-),score=39.92 NODE_3302_length_992_cov_27.517919_g3156_i0:78-923(-)